MRRSNRRLLYLIALLPVTVLLAAGLYQWGMAMFEGKTRDFWSAIEFASETITSTGYGADSKWTHPLMIAYVISLQFIGVVLTYMVVPIVLVPFLEERMERRLPSKAPKLNDHVLIYRYGPPVATVLDELLGTRTPVLMIENDERSVRRLMDHQAPVVYRPTFEETFDQVGLAKARALILNGDDEENAALTVVARQHGYSGQILTLVEEPFYRSAMTLAGADIVFSPRRVLAGALAARASQRIRPRLDGAQHLGTHVEIREIRLDAESPLAGQTLAESRVGSVTGAVIVGLWIRGILQPQPAADQRLEARDILIAVGNCDSLDRLSNLAGGRQHIPAHRPFLVAGYGEVGQQVTKQLRQADEEVVVIDRVARDGVDVVGDILDPAMAEGIDFPKMQGIILALDNDKGALFATVISKHRAPDVPIIVRVNGAENVEPIHRAGADFALSIAEVSGRMLVRSLLRRETYSIDPKLHIDRLQAPRLAGSKAHEADIRQRTGCSVILVERDDVAHTELGDDFVFAASDTLVICGTAEANGEFRRLYG